MNRKRKHPLEEQLDADWNAGLFVIIASCLCAALVSLPIMSRARFSAGNEPEREPMQTNQRLEVSSLEGNDQEK